MQNHIRYDRSRTNVRDCIKTQVMLAAVRLSGFRTDRDVEQAQRRTTSDVTDPGPQVWGYLAALPTVGVGHRQDYFICGSI